MLYTGRRRKRRQHWYITILIISLLFIYNDGYEMIAEIVAWRDNRDRQEIAKIYAWTFFVYSSIGQILWSSVWDFFVLSWGLSWIPSLLLFLWMDVKILLIFRRLYLPNFPSQPYSQRNSYFRRPFVTASWTTLITEPNWLTRELTNQRTAKKVCQGSSLVYYNIGWISCESTTNSSSV